MNPWGAWKVALGGALGRAHWQTLKGHFIIWGIFGGLTVLWMMGLTGYFTQIESRYSYIDSEMRLWGFWADHFFAHPRVISVPALMGLILGVVSLSSDRRRKLVPYYLLLPMSRLRYCLTKTIIGCVEIIGILSVIGMCVMGSVLIFQRGLPLDGLCSQLAIVGMIMFVNWCYGFLGEMVIQNSKGVLGVGFVVWILEVVVHGMFSGPFFRLLTPFSLLTSPEAFLSHSFPWVGGAYWVQLSLLCLGVAYAVFKARDHTI